MKTNRFLYMTMVCAALGLSACTSDTILDNDETTAPVEVQGDEAGFTSIIGDNFDMLPTEDLDGGEVEDTRSTMSDGAFASWATSDKISISDGALFYTYQPTDESINGTSCTFEPMGGKSFINENTTENSTFYAFYPADAVKGWSGTTVTTMIYTEQKYSENVENSGVMGPYMAATATTTGSGTAAKAGFKFGHICSVIDVNLSGFDGGEVESVALYANSQISLAGSMQYNFSTKAATVSGGGGAGYSNSLQSEVVRVSEINATQPVVRFYILPMRQEQGFTITVRTSDGKYYTKSSSTSVGGTELNDYITSQDGVTGGTLCKPYYKKYNFGGKSTARTQNWMAMIPGNVKFNHLSIPGTHDAATSSMSGAYYKCQAFTITEQLQKGCRAFDLRPTTSTKNGDPYIYHGDSSTGVTLGDALSAITSFLSANPTETAFVLIHEENSSSHSTTWSNYVWTILNNYSSNIASYGWNRNLNPCRGKMVVIFRDNYTDGTNTDDLGCGKVGWGSSFDPKTIMTGNGSGTNSGYTLYYQDEYEYTSSSYVREKLTKLENMLTNYIAANETNSNYLYVNNTNCIKGSSMFGNVVINTDLKTSAAAVNEAVLGSTTFTNHTGKFGIMMTDFLFSSDQNGDRMFELIHKQNYKYVYKNRTRCTGTNTGLNIVDENADNTTVYSKKH